jgi:hypothetical protein
MLRCTQIGKIIGWNGMAWKSSGILINVSNYFIRVYALNYTISNLFHQTGHYLGLVSNNLQPTNVIRLQFTASRNGGLHGGRPCNKRKGRPKKDTAPTGQVGTVYTRLHK